MQVFLSVILHKSLSWYTLGGYIYSVKIQATLALFAPSVVTHELHNRSSAMLHSKFATLAFDNNGILPFVISVSINKFDWSTRFLYVIHQSTIKFISFGA